MKDQESNNMEDQKSNDIKDQDSENLQDQQSNYLQDQELDKLKHQEDVSPSEALEKLVIDEETEHPAKTTGTGANNSVPRADSLIIKKDDEDQDE